MATTGPGYASDYYRALRANAAFGQAAGAIDYPSTYRLAMLASAPVSSSQVIDELSGSGYSSPTVQNDTSTWLVDEAGGVSIRVNVSLGTSSAIWVPSTGIVIIDPDVNRWLVYAPFVDTNDNPVTSEVGAALIVRINATQLVIEEA